MNSPTRLSLNFKNTFPEIRTPAFLTGLFLFIGLFFSSIPSSPAAVHHKIQAGGTELTYIDEGSGRPVVMIHGSHSSLYTYELSVFDRVAQKYRAVAIDLSGFGESRRLKKRMTLEEHADVIHDALLKLGVREPVMVGHSYGGAVVLCYLLKYQKEVHSAVLLSPYMAPFEHIFIGHRLANKPVIGDLFIWTVVKPIQLLKKDENFMTGAFYPDPVNKAYAKKEIPLALRRKALESNARDIYALRDALNQMAGRYGEIKVPVTILAGDSDKIAPTEIHGAFLHEQIPGSKFILLPKTGHLPAFTKSAEVLSAIDEAAA